MDFFSRGIQPISAVGPRTGPRGWIESEVTVLGRACDGPSRIQEIFAIKPGNSICGYFPSYTKLAAHRKRPTGRDSAKRLFRMGCLPTQLPENHLPWET
jgi:hypothetical protein